MKSQIRILMVMILSVGLVAPNRGQAQHERPVTQRRVQEKVATKPAKKPIKKKDKKEEEESKPADKFANNLDKPIPIPEPIIVNKTDMTIEDAITAVINSEPHESVNEKDIAGRDVYDYEAEQMKKFAKREGRYAQYKDVEGIFGVMMPRYNAGPEAGHDIREAAAGLGEFIAILDADNIMTGKFEKNEPYNFDYRNATINEKSPLAKTVAILYEGGLFKHVTPDDPTPTKYMVVMDALNNPRDKKKDPLSHQKEMIFYIKRPDGTVLFVDYIITSANANRDTRVNDGVHFNVPELAQYAYEHGLDMIKTFLNRMPIHAIPERRPIQMDFSNGKVTLGYTDGKYDWNQPIEQVFLDIASGALRVMEGFMSQFVYTYTKGHKALRAALKAEVERAKAGGYNPFKLTAIVDGKFTGPRQANLFGGLEGMPTVFGGFERGEPGSFMLFPLDRDSRKLVQAYSYQRQIPGIEMKDPKGIPIANFLLHSKRTFFRIMGSGKLPAMVRAFLGSFNYSNAFHSAETRIIIETEETSWFAKALFAAAKALTKSPFSIPGKKAIFIQSLADLTGHTDKEIYDPESKEKMAELERLLDVLGANDFANQKAKPPRAPELNLVEARRAMNRFAQMATEVDPKNRAEQKIIDERVKSVIDTLEAYAEIPKENKFYETLPIQFLAVVMQLAANPHDPAPLRRQQLDFVFNVSPDKMPPAELEAKRGELWKKLGFKDEMPPEQKRESDKPSTGASKPKPPTRRGGGAGSCQALVSAA